MMRYLAPSVAAVGLIIGIFVFGGKSTHPEKVKGTGDSLSLEEEGPHGRVVYLVVDFDGVHCGDEYAPLIIVDRFLEQTVRPLEADYAIVIGTNDAKHGDVVRVYDAVRSHFRFPSNVYSLPVPGGTRRKSIEVHEHPWEY